MSINANLLYLAKIVEFASGGGSATRFEIELPGALNDSQWVLRITGVDRGSLFTFPVFKDDDIEVCISKATQEIRGALSQRKIAIQGELRKLESMLSE